MSLSMPSGAYTEDTLNNIAKHVYLATHKNPEKKGSQRDSTTSPTIADRVRAFAESMFASSTFKTMVSVGKYALALAALAGTVVLAVKVSPAILLIGFLALAML